MKKEYVKGVLYLYPKIDKEIVYLDKLKLNLALKSMDDTSPAEEQCFNITYNCIYEKAILQNLKIVLREILSHYSEDDIKHFAYKYWRQGVPGLDTTSKKYFRKQHRLIKKLCADMVKLGYDDTWFEEQKSRIINKYVRYAIEWQQNRRGRISKKEKQS